MKKVKLDVRKENQWKNHSKLFNKTFAMDFFNYITIMFIVIASQQINGIYSQGKKIVFKL